jgi:sulfhydrogenase subunit beta (sulfur reductase)
VRFIDAEGFAGLLSGLRERGYDLIGPVVRNGAIVLDRIEGVDDLPRGVREIQGPGTYRLHAGVDDRLFGSAHGPDSAKRFLFPARERLATLARSGSRLSESVEDSGEEPPMAFVGLRSCDLHAIEVQDRVLGRDPSYARRRHDAFIVAVDCAEPGATCFCAGMGTGPRCTSGFDLALTELERGFLVAVGSPRGAEVLDAVGSRPAEETEVLEADRIAREATARMGRAPDLAGVQPLLYRNRQHPEWEAVAERCLACGNCTSVCPTCFCHDVVDTPDLLDVSSERSREWASCFSLEFSHVAGGQVRSTRAARYRQWLSHKFASWIDQYGTSGCVGCGRCITWCPVGIDVTEEIEAIRASDGLVEVAS